MMSQIFISYSRRNAELVDAIVEKVEAAGIGVWIDREDIRAGKAWRVQIVQAIATCDAFVLLLSSHSAASDNVRREIDLAQDAGRAVFILKLDPVQLPVEMLYQLVGLQHIELQQLGMDQAIRRLIDTLDENFETWKVHDDRSVRQVELVFREGSRAEFGVKKQAETLELISAVTGAPSSQLKMVGLETGGVHVRIDLPATAAFVLKTRALNRDRRLKQFGIECVRLVGDKHYVNISLGILTLTATFGYFNGLWMSLLSLLGLARGKVVGITTILVGTTAVGMALAAGTSSGPAQMVLFTNTSPGVSTSLPSPTAELPTATLIPVASSAPASTASPTTHPTSPPLPTQTTVPTRTPTNTPATTDTPIPTDTPVPTDTPTPIATATVLPEANEPLWTGAWTHINPGSSAVGSGQTFIAGEPDILTVDVSILTANPGRGDDTITLNLLSADQQVLGISSQLVADGVDGWLHFQFPDPGIMVTPGDTFIIALQDTGNTTFGWRYIGDTYSNGHAIMLGADEQSYDFFFRINR